MKYAAQTIIYGDDIADWNAVLGEIASIGYEGVELFQTYNKIGDPAEFDRLLDVHRLQVIGLSGGSFRDRLTLATHLRHKPLYLYLDNTHELPCAYDSSFACVAVHPHLYMPIANMQAAEALFVKGFKFLPDTAHLFLSGETTSARLIDAIRRNLQHVIAIHLKDWSPQYGWTRATYARGFTELGKGTVPLQEVWDWIRASFTGWVVVEQDTTEQSPAESLSQSLLWLDPSRTAGRPHPPAQIPHGYLTAAPYAGAVVTDFVSLLHAQQCRTPEIIYHLCVDYLVKIFSCVCVLMYEVHCDFDFLTLAGAAGDVAPPTDLCEIAISISAARAPIAERVIRTLDLKLTDEARSPEADFGLKCGARYLTIVPLNNCFNPHQPELVLLLLSTVRLSEQDPLLTGLSLHVRRGVEGAWAEARSQVASEVNYAAGYSRTLQQFLEAMCSLLATKLKCESVSTYMPNPTETGLRRRATSGKSLAAVQDIGFEEKASPVIQCFAERRPILAVPSAQDRVRHKGSDHLAAPYCVFPLHKLLPLSEVRGVIVCEGLDSRGLSRSFSLSDQNSIDAVQSTAAPHIDRLAAEELREESLRRIKHELRGPILMVRGIEELLEDEYEDVRYLMKTCRALLRDPVVSESEGGRKVKNALLRIEHSLELRDITSIDENMALMNAVIGKVSFLRLAGSIELSTSRTPLWKEVVGPCLKALRALARRRGLPIQNIVEQPASQPPALYVDRMRFREVVFNLLDNAIKYAKPGTAAFRLELGEASRTGSATRLHIRDWGIGIQSGWEHKIFHEGVRAPNAAAMGVAGDGFGLWYSRRIVEAHGGSLDITSMAEPTEVTIVLPPSVQEPVFKSAKDT